MKLPNWLHFILIAAGMGGLTRILTYFLLLILFSNFGAIASLNLELDLVVILLFPYVISLSAAYALVSRRIPNPSERRLPFSIIVTLIGAIMFLSGSTGYFAGIGFYNSFDPAFEILNILTGFGVMLIGFTLALPRIKYRGLLTSYPAQPDHPNPAVNEETSHLPAAGLAMLIATILTSLVILLLIPSAVSQCYSSPATCHSPIPLILGIFSSLGVVTGTAATSSLLKGRYRSTVPLALILFTLSSLFIFIAWGDLFLIAIPIFALCLSSTVLIVLNQDYSTKMVSNLEYGIKASDRKTISVDWKVICILSAGLGAFALGAGILQFIPGTWNVCKGFFVRPYLNNAGLLLGLGATGIIFALMIADSVRRGRAKPAGVLKTKQVKVKRSWSFKVLIILITISLLSTTVFAAALVAATLPQCSNTFCYTQVEQLSVLQATPVPSSNQVTFNLANSGTLDITIIVVQVRGGAISNPTSASQLSISMVCAGKINTLTATFQGVTFVQGTTYYFLLISSNGHTFPYSTTA